MKLCVIDARIGTVQADMVFNNAYPGKTAVEHALDMSADLWRADRTIALVNRDDFREEFPADVEFVRTQSSEEDRGLEGLLGVFDTLSGAVRVEDEEADVVILRPGVGVISEGTLEREIAMYREHPETIVVNYEDTGGSQHPSWLYLANNLSEKQVYRVGPTPLFNLVPPDSVFDDKVVSNFPLIGDVVGSQFLPKLYTITGSVITGSVKAVFDWAAGNKGCLSFCPSVNETRSPVFAYNLPIFCSPRLVGAQGEMA